MLLKLHVSPFVLNQMERTVHDLKDVSRCIVGGSYIENAARQYQVAGRRKMNL